MIGEWTEVVAGGLYWVCLAAWRTVPVFAVVLVLCLVARTRIPARWQCLLWMLVIARLLLPISASSPIAVSATVDRAFQSLFSTGDESVAAGSRLIVQDFKSNGRRAADEGAYIETNYYLAEKIGADVEPASSRHAAPILQPERSDALASATDAVLGISAYLLVWAWISGVAFILLRGILTYGRFAWTLRRSPVVAERHVIDQALRVCDDLGVSRRPAIRQVDAIDAPAMFGFWRPALCLPRDWRDQLSNQELDWVLRHELAHVKRRDSLVLAIGGFARAVHWMNPMSWIAVARLRTSIEHAADEVATRGLSETCMADYGRLLLRYADGQPHTPQPAIMGLLSMSSSRGLRHRIESLGHESGRRRWLARCMMLPIVLCIAAAGLTDASNVDTKPKAPRSLPDIQVALNDAAIDTTTVIATNAPAETKHSVTLDVHRAIEKAGEIQPGINAERFLIHYLAFPDAGAARISEGALTAELTPTQERLSRAMLKAFERSGAWQVAVECRIMQADVEQLRSLDWYSSEVTAVRFDSNLPIVGTSQADLLAVLEDPHANVLANRTRPALAAVMDQRRFASLIDACQSDPRRNVLQAPKVTLFNGQSATICDLVQRPFVTDVRLVSGDLASAFQPVIEVVDEGWTIRMQAEVTEDEGIELTCGLCESRVEDVQLADLPPTASMGLDEGITIQVPNVHCKLTAVRCMLNAGEALCIASPQPYRRDDHESKKIAQVYVIRPILIPESETLQAFTPGDEDR